MSKKVKVLIFSLLIGSLLVVWSYFLGLKDFSITYPIREKNEIADDLEIKSQKLLQVKNLEINLDNYDIEIEKSGDKTNKITYPCGSKRKLTNIEIEEKDGKLKISEKKRPEAEVYIGFSMPKKEEYNKIKLQLANDDDIENSNIYLSNRDLIISKLKFKNTYISLSNGAILANGGSYDGVDFFCENGDIDLSDLFLKDSNIKNENGDISAKVSGKNKLKIENENGNTELYLLKNQKVSLKLESSKGEINLEDGKDRKNYQEIVKNPDFTIEAKNENGHIYLHKK